MQVLATPQTIIVKTNNVIGKTKNVQYMLSNIYVLVLVLCNLNVK
jgi:hypothetical protein